MTGREEGEEEADGGEVDVLVGGGGGMLVDGAVPAAAAAPASAMLACVACVVMGVDGSGGCACMWCYGVILGWCVGGRSAGRMMVGLSSFVTHSCCYTTASPRAWTRLSSSVLVYVWFEVAWL